MWALHGQVSTFPPVEFLVTVNLNQVVRLDRRVPARLRFSGGPHTVEASPGFLPQIADMPLTAVSLSSLPVISYSSFHHPPTRPHPALALYHVSRVWGASAVQGSAFAAEVFPSNISVVEIGKNCKCWILDFFFNHFCHFCVFCCWGAALAFFFLAANVKRGWDILGRAGPPPICLPHPPAATSAVCDRV